MDFPKQFNLWLAGVISATATGCAGPSTPLGAVWVVKPPERAPLFTVLFKRPSDRWAAPQLRLEPPRQVLHDSRPLEIWVDDPEGLPDDLAFSVRYNGLDVTETFLFQAKIEKHPETHRLMVRVPGIKLSPATEHLIEFGYGSRSKGMLGYTRLGPPRCDSFAQKLILTTESFSPPARILDAIEKVSDEAGFNPAFTAGLVAQESGFNPRTVSMARALGLTQVTPSAEVEVSKRYPAWPRHPAANDLPAPILRFLVEGRVMNRDNEWRLDEELSIRGGLTYVEDLSERLEDPAIRERISILFEDTETARTQLLLASYHSGFTRVLGALGRYGPAWLSAPDLTAARRYVNRVTSFCDHFSRLPEAEPNFTPVIATPNLVRTPAGA